ncbi:CU044_5270 family protein [Actinomadura miaoliensis]|uniref:CU044_5270 family protein n=1 Tax=Actinomadura miaoliensis TaxID=430685 RepID=A0ABP7X563_9ACTN
MDELDALRQMRTALAEEEPPERIALRTGWRPDAAPRRRRRNWRIPLVSVIAAGAATVTAVSLISSGGSSGRTSGPGGQGTVPLSGNVLLVAASNAEKAPTGRYWHTETVMGQIYGVGKSAADHYKVDSRQRNVVWVGPDGSANWAHVDLAGRPLTAEDMRRWRQAGSPQTVEVPNPEGPEQAVVFMNAPAPGNRLPMRPTDAEYFGMSVKQVAGLPTDPEALEKALLKLRGNWHASSSSNRQEPISALRGEERTRALSEVAGTLLSRAPAPPRVRAAAFRMLAALPGVKAEGTAADPMGRPGTVISLPLETTVPLGLYTAPKQLGTYRRQWIVDPAGGRLLAIRDVVATPPRGSRPLPPGDNGRPRALKAENMPDRFHRPGELASYELFEVAEWTDTPPK